MNNMNKQPSNSYGYEETKELFNNRGNNIEEYYGGYDEGNNRLAELPRTEKVKAIKNANKLKKVIGVTLAAAITAGTISLAGFMIDKDNDQAFALNQEENKQKATEVFGDGEVSTNTGLLSGDGEIIYEDKTGDTVTLTMDKVVSLNENKADNLDSNQIDSATIKTDNGKTINLEYNKGEADVAKAAQDAKDILDNHNKN